MISEDELSQCCSEIWNQLNLEADRVWFNYLIECYSQTHRHYHTVQHLKECYELFESVKVFCCHSAEVALAIWFHDAVYESKEKDNELKSAEIAKNYMLEKRLPVKTVENVVELILSTAHHQPISCSLDTEILLDNASSLPNETR